MTCKEFRNNLEDHRLGRLPDPMKEAVETHVLGCKSCKAYVKAMESLDVFIAGARNATPDPFVSTRILQRLETEYLRQASPKKTAWPLLLKPVAITLALAAGMLIGTLTTQQSTGSDKATAADSERLQELKQDLFISEFADEDKIIPLIP